MDAWRRKDRRRKLPGQRQRKAWLVCVLVGDEYAGWALVGTRLGFILRRKHKHTHTDTHRHTHTHTHR